jgi:hypothetical protein
MPWIYRSKFGMTRKKKSRDSVEPETRLVHSDADGDPAQGGQSGDLQGLSDVAGADSQSVRELLEEGQYFEASVVSGVENAPPADAGPVKTHEVPEDDVPPEYVDHPKGEPRE